MPMPRRTCRHRSPLLSASFSPGYQPPSGRPSGVVRVTAVCRPRRGFSGTPGQSLPKASRPAPAADAVVGPAAGSPLGADVLEPHIHLTRARRAEVRLHGGDDAERSEAREVGRVYRFEVLDSVPAAPLRQRIRSHRVLVRRERHVHGAVADGVRHHLPAASVEQPHHAVEVVGLDRRRAGRRVVVGVRREHRGRVRFDDAVQHDLDRAGFEERVVGVSLRDRVELGNGRLAQRSRGGQRRIDANAEVPVAPRVGVDLEVRGVAAGVLHAGDAVSLRLDNRRAQCAGAVGRAWLSARDCSRAPSRLP